MKKLAFSLIVCFVFSLTAMNAQEKKCCASNTTAPKLAAGIGTVVSIGDPTPTPTLTTPNSSDLPNVEYLITKKGQLAGSDPNGDVIIGADVDGSFIPGDVSKYGFELVAGDTFEITPVGFNLSAIQTLADSLLRGTRTQGSLAGEPCCTLFEQIADALVGTQPNFTSADSTAISNFCDTVNARGINSGADVAGLNEFIIIFDAFSSNPLSIESLVDVLETLNDQGQIIQSDCGGAGANDFVSYGLWLDARAGNPVPVEQLGQSETAFMVYPNPASDLVQLHVTTKETIDFQVRMYSSLGQEVRSTNLNGVNGNDNISIDVSDLTKGMYYIELNDGVNKMTKKVMVH